MSLLAMSLLTPAAFAEKYNERANGDSADSFDFDQEMLQLEKRSRLKGPALVKRKKRVKRKIGINVVMLYNSVGHIGTTNNSINTTNSFYGTNSTYNNLAQTTGEYQSHPSFGIGAEYSKKALLKAGPVGFGFGAGAIYEFERELQRRYLSYGYTAPTSYSNTIYGSSNPTMSVIQPYLNANISYKQSYMFGGLNYSVVNTKNLGDESIDGKMGYQVGVGATVSRWVAVEVAHRWTLMQAKPSTVAYYNSVAYSQGAGGLGISDTEDLNVTGLTLNLKVLF